MWMWPGYIGVVTLTTMTAVPTSVTTASPTAAQSQAAHVVVSLLKFGIVLLNESCIVRPLVILETYVSHILCIC